MQPFIHVVVVAVVALATAAEAIPFNNDNNNNNKLSNEKLSGADILWDNWAVPHIFADDYDSALYAFGWAHGRAHGNALVHLFAETRARSSEYWGEQYEPLDIAYLADRIPQTAAAYWPLMSNFSRQVSNAFARGFSDYCAAHPEEIEPRLQIALPISGQDVYAHGIHVLHVFTYAAATSMAADFQNEHGGGKDDEAFRRRHESGQVKYAAFANRTALYWGNLTAEEREVIGSNAWAINGQRSDDGGAKLVVNPHLMYAWYFRWFEAHIVIPSEGVDYYGANLIGLPCLNVGFNDFLGWTHTVNVQRAYTGYQLDMVSETQYRFDGQVLTLAQQQFPYRVLLADGSYDDRVVVVETSVHGVVYSRSGDNQVLVTRLGGIDDAPRPNAVQQVWDMMRARSKEEFLAALSQNQLSMFTTMYADRDNNIAHAFLSFTPDRTGMTPTTYAEWGRAQPGHSSANLWTRVLDFEELPYFENPPSGYLQNANEPPWTTTLPLYYKHPSTYPAFITDAPRMSMRSLISVRLMDGSFNATFEDLEALKLSVLVEETFHALDDLLDYCNEFGDADTRVVCNTVLGQWEREYDGDSRGATLFQAWERQFSGYANGWSDQDPLGTPNTLNDPEGDVALLTQIIRQWRLVGRELDEQLGEVYNFPATGGYVNPNATAWPGNGGNNCFRCLYYAVPTPEQPDKGIMPGGGDTIVMVVQFSRTGRPRARSCLGTGNTSQRDTAWGQRHINDQSELMSRRVLRDVLLNRADIEANLELQERIDI